MKAIIKIVETDKEIEDVKALFMEYVNLIGVHLPCFQNFSREVEDLPGDYVSPKGNLWIAYNTSLPAGCIALRLLEKNVGEMKRLYVKPDDRGHGLGKKLIQTAIQYAVSVGYQSIRLDTLSSMKEAIAL